METVFNFQRPRRMSERKTYINDVNFSTGVTVHPATIKNVSLGGALIGSFNLPKLKMGQEIKISIPFAAREGSVKRDAVVMWAEEFHFGIQFI